MHPAGIISALLSSLILFGTDIFACNLPDHFRERTIIDTVHLFPCDVSITGSKALSYQTGRQNFYKTDSLFSFHSPKGYLPSLIHNIGEQATAPFHFSKKDWLVTGAIAGITTFLFFEDENIDNWARTQKQKHEWVNISSPVASEFGSTYGVCTAIATGIVSAAFKKEKGVRTSMLATQAMITSGLWTQIIKQLTGRERPKAAYMFSLKEGGKWYGPFGKYNKSSPFYGTGFSFDAFPSGHTATAFSIATVFATEYSENKAIPVLCYSAATAVGVSRLFEHEHWASDVFAGAILGYFSGKQVVSHFHRMVQNSYSDRNRRQKELTRITFIQEGNQVGFSIKW